MKMPRSSVLLDYLKVGGKQFKLQFSDFVVLTDTLVQNSNCSVIKRCKEELMKTPIADWEQLIDKTASTIHLSDKVSV